MFVFVGSKLGDIQSAAKDKYETAEEALQKKWQKYCSRGELSAHHTYLLAIIIPSNIMLSVVFIVHKIDNLKSSRYFGMNF